MFILSYDHNILSAKFTKMQLQKQTRQKMYKKHNKVVSI